MQVSRHLIRLLPDLFLAQPCVFLKVVWCVVCANSYAFKAILFLFFFVSFFASMSACSFPLMLVCALTLYIVVGCVRVFSISTIDVSMVLSA